MEKVRYHLSVYVLWVGYLVAPRLMRPVLTAMLDAFAGLPQQIESGRQGGLVMAPWFISAAGQSLARKQLRACASVAYDIRRGNEERDSFLDPLIGLEPHLEP
jgi:hypothetical protein